MRNGKLIDPEVPRSPVGRSNGRLKVHGPKVETGLPFTIDANAVFDVNALCRSLGLKRSTIAREIKRGRLRAAQISNRHWFLGLWVVQWIEAAELQTRGGREHGDPNR